MSLPAASTTVAVLRRPGGDATVDAYTRDPNDRTQVISGVRAHISPLSGRQALTGDIPVEQRFRLLCDPVTLQREDYIVDETAGVTYELVWSSPVRVGPLDHVRAELRLVEGVES